jgi:Cu-processing system permease protein
VVLSWELRERTVLAVLARPVARAEFLVAKWLAVLIMTLTFLAIGVVFGLLYAWDLNVQILPMLKVALTATAASILCFTAVSITLSVFLSPVVTSVIGIFMVIAPDLVKQLFGHQWASLRAIAAVIYYAFPAGMPVSLINDSFGKIALNPNYSLYSRVMFENLFYGVFAFLLAAAVFSRREIPTAS